MYNVHPFLTPWFLDNSSYSLELSIYKLSEASKPSCYLFTSHLSPACSVWLIFSDLSELSLLSFFFYWEQFTLSQMRGDMTPGPWFVTDITCESWCLHSAVSPTSTPPQQPSWSLPWAGCGGHVRCCCCDVRTWGTTHTRVLLWWNFIPIVNTNRALCFIIWNIMSK